jgi:maltose O-acetyltransferase
MDIRTSSRRQQFFLKRRLFAIISFFLLDNRLSGNIRASVLRWMGAKVGKNCFIRGSLSVQEEFDFEIGDNVFINAGCTLDGSAKITIDDNVQFGYNVTLCTGGHAIGPETCRAGEHKAQPILIGAGSWIGANAMILPGVEIGPGCVVGAGSVVVKTVEPNMLAVGNPARQIKYLETNTATPSLKTI